MEMNLNKLSEIERSDWSPSHLTVCMHKFNSVVFQQSGRNCFFLKFVPNQIESVRTFFASNTFCVASVAESLTQECA